jgi:hypothetical protein
VAKRRPNDPCFCGSGRKYKDCCLARDERLAESEATRRTAVQIALDWLLDNHESLADAAIAEGFFGEHSAESKHWTELLEGLPEEVQELLQLNALEWLLAEGTFQRVEEKASGKARPGDGGERKKKADRADHADHGARGARSERGERGERGERAQRAERDGRSDRAKPARNDDDEEGTLAMDLVLQPGGPSLTVGERSYLRSLTEHALRLYEVIDVQPGAEMALKPQADLTQPIVRVVSRAAPGVFTKGDLLAVRPIPIGDRWELSGSVYWYPPELASVLVKGVRRFLNEAPTRAPELDAAELDALIAGLLRDVWLESALGPVEPDAVG